MNHNWRAVTVSANTTTEEVIAVIDRSALRTALVVDEHERLLGVVTDGDIRRGILAHQPMDAPVSSIMNTQPLTMTPDSGRAERLRAMNKKNALALPIVDAGGLLVGLETLQPAGAETRKDNTVFLMAGGLGTRLRPLTEEVPKPMLRVRGKPILELILERFIDHGFCNFFISVNYLADRISNYFGDGSRWGVSIEYVRESEPLGTGGALSLLPHTLGAGPLIMMNGDILTKIDFDELLRFHEKASAQITVAGRLMANRIPYGVIETSEDRVTAIKEKPNQEFFINAGIYVVDQTVRQQLPENERVDMPGVITDLIERGEKVAMFPIHEYWLDIGQMPDYERAQREFAQGEQVPFSDNGKSPTDG